MIMRAEQLSDDQQEDGDQIVYYMDVLKDHSSSEYISLSRYIEDYPINGGYALYDGTLEYFEDQVEKVKSGDFETDIVIDPTVTKRIEQSAGESLQNLFNPATFRDFVLAGYGNACAITGRKIENALGVGIDVVYIKPRSEGGSCLPSNGLPLTKEYSMLFVQGYFTLSDKYEIIVHPDNTSELLTDLNLRQIRIPPKTLFQPDKDSLSYHREHVFGSFKY
jgi:predicted restriction endonuclease